MVSRGYLHFDSSTSEFRNRAFITHLARIITGFIKVFPLGCCSLFTGDIIASVFRNQVTLSCKCIGKCPRFY